MGSWNFTRVDEAFASAAIDSTRWSEALQCLASETESVGAIILPVSGEIIPNPPTSDALAMATEVYFRDGWYQRDLRYNADISRFARNGVMDDFDSTPESEIPKQPYYQDFLAKCGLRWFAGVAMQTDKDLWCVSINRGAAAQPFTTAEKQKLAALSRRLSTSATVAKALGFTAAAAALEAFDISGTACVLLNSNAEVIRINQAADRLFQSGDVRVQNKRIVASTVATSAALDKALHQVLWTEAGTSLMPAIALQRESGQPILAYPIKLPALTSHPFGEAQAALVLVEPAARRQVPEQTLRLAFDLTAAEARLASRFGRGESLEKICDQLGVSKETGRHQLKRIFSKMGISRQADLVLTMARML